MILLKKKSTTVILKTLNAERLLYRGLIDELGRDTFLFPPKQSIQSKFYHFRLLMVLT